MKHVAVTFTVISFLPCLGIGEEKARPMASAYHQLQFTQLISEFEVQPDSEKHSDADHATSNVRAAPTFRRRKHAKYRASIGRIQGEMESSSVLGGTHWKPWLPSFPSLHYALALQQQPANHAFERRIGSFDAYEEPCRPWWKWVLPCNNIHEADTGIDMQGLSVLNQSPGARRSFYSLDLSANLAARNWDFCKTPQDDICTQTVSFSVLHEPALGLIASIHFRDPGDTASVATSAKR